MKKIWGKISYAFAKSVDFVLSIILRLVESVTNLGDTLLKAILPFVIMIVISALFFWPLLLVFLTPLGMTAITVVLIIAIISILGRRLLNYLNRLYYVSTNYFYDYADYYRLGKQKNESFSYYSNRYTEELNRKFEEERRRAEEERRKRQEAENERWRKFFEENFSNYQGSYQQGGYYGGQSSSSYNPFSGFKRQYEDACDTLGVPYTATFPEIKKAYRILAKKYHPDLSNERNAEEMFKKINNAFDFLTEENVERYSRL